MLNNGRIHPDPTDTERLPPHSAEAEAGILGCVLLDPAAGLEACIAAHISTASFHDVRHRAIWEAMLDCHDAMDPVDPITIQEKLKGAGKFEESGGLAYISGLQDGVPSAANLPHYLEIVTEKQQLRRMLSTFSDVVGRIHEGAAVAELIADCRESVERSLTSRTAAGAGLFRTFSDLAAFDFDHDPTALLGQREDGTTSRYLCRGGSGWIIGPSGVGKSSLVVQMAMLWCLGQPAFGITPPAPLRITLIQAENDEGDLAEMLQGVQRALGVEFNEEAVALLQQNLRVRTEVTKTGAAWCQWLRQVVTEDRCDIILADPFLSFAGIDVSRQDQCSQFLRNWLNPVLKSTGAAILGIHHTGKPAKREKGQSAPVTALDQAYAGLGSSELVNWARLVMSLRSVDEGSATFCLTLSKRGRRSGAVHPDGSWAAADGIWLQQAQKGIWWQQVDPPKEEEAEAPAGAKQEGGRPSKVDELIGLGLGLVIDGLTEPQSKTEVARRFEAHAASRKLDVSLRTAITAVEKLVANGAILKSESGYLKA